MQIGILQTGQAPDALKPETGDYPAFFERLLEGHGFTFRSWHVEAMEFPDSIHDADGWLITGSRHGAYEDHPFIKPLEAFIRGAYAAHVPLVGICFGHQIIAQALGGKVEKFAGGRTVGATEYDFGGERLTLNAWHQDQVTEVPTGARVIAKADMCANAAMVYDDRAFSVQPHPEFRPDFIDGLLRTRAPGVVPPDRIEGARDRLSEPIADGTIAGRIAAFFKMPRAERPAA